MISLISQQLKIRKKFGALASKIKSFTKNRPKSERNPKDFKINPYAPNVSNKDKRRTVLVQLALNGHSDSEEEVNQGGGEVSTVTVRPAELPINIDKKAKNFKEKFRIFAESELFQPIVTAVCTYFAFLIFTIYLLWNIM